MGSLKWAPIWNLLTCRGEPRGRKSREVWVELCYLSFPPKASYLLGFSLHLGAVRCAPTELLNSGYICCERLLWCAFSSKSSSSIHPVSGMSCHKTHEFSEQWELPTVESPIPLRDIINVSLPECNTGADRSKVSWHAFILLCRPIIFMLWVF